MSIHRYAAKRDDNERPIITALQLAGAAVLQLDDFDLLVCYPPPAGPLFMLEVKKRKGKLTKNQLKIREVFPLAKVETPAEALRAIGAAK